VADPVLDALLHELRGARERGASFPSAWPPACRAALALANDYDRPAWPRVFEATRPAWSSAYHRTPPPASAAAVAALAAALVDAEPDEVESRGRLVA
jgi:hypothetical protein